MEFGIKPVALNEQDSKQLDRALRCIRTIQSTIRFKLLEPKELAESKYLSWPLESIDDLHQCENIIVVSTRPFDDNWFSHSTHGISAISTAGWSELFAPPGLASFLMLEIALSVYTQITDSLDEALGPHASAIGCLLDFCIQKSDISWKMRCGSLCASHQGLFREHGGSPRQLHSIQRILEATRLTAFGRLAFDDLPVATPKSKVFIGSSGKTRRVAYALQQCIESECSQAECSVWTDGIFRPSRSILSTLLKCAAESDFAVLVAGRDDVAVLRGEDVTIPRDNVTFELGLFIGALGMGRTFLVCPENAPALPSDLAGIIHISFRERVDDNFEAALRPGASRIVTEIEELGTCDRWTKYIRER